MKFADRAAIARLANPVKITSRTEATASARDHYRTYGFILGGAEEAVHQRTAGLDVERVQLFGAVEAKRHHRAGAFLEDCGRCPLFRDLLSDTHGRTLPLTSQSFRLFRSSANFLKYLIVTPPLVSAVEGRTNTCAP